MFPLSFHWFECTAIILYKCLDISLTSQEASKETNESRIHHENITEEDIEANNITSEVLSVDEGIKDNTDDGANNDELDYIRNDDSFKESENQEGTEKEKTPRIGKKLNLLLIEITLTNKKKLYNF